METNPPVNVQCCALRQMQASNATSLRTLKQRMNELKANGYRAVFVVTLVTEPLLVEKLKELGFEPIAKFARRTQYDKTKLTMWFKHW